MNKPGWITENVIPPDLDLPMQTQRTVPCATSSLQVLSSKKKIAIMPGYTRPTHQDIVSVPLDNGIQINVGVAYMEALTTSEKAFISTSLQFLNPQRAKFL